MVPNIDDIEMDAQTSSLPEVFVDDSEDGRARFEVCRERIDPVLGPYFVGPACAIFERDDVPGDYCVTWPWNLGWR